MKAYAPILAAAVLAASLAGPAQAVQPDPAVPAAADSEPLPPGAPTDPYELAAWCYGAMSEYLEVYDRVKPDLRDIDRMFGTSVKHEAEPYQDDIHAARDELKVLAGAVESAEKASSQVIAPRGADAVRLGRSIWSPAEEKTRRELARACDSNARTLASRSALLGQALKFNVQGEQAHAPVTGPVRP
jgi:hypothetical protein